MPDRCEWCGGADIEEVRQPPYIHCLCRAYGCGHEWDRTPRGDERPMAEIKLPVKREPGRGDVHAADGRFLGTLPYPDSAAQVLQALNDHAALRARAEAAEAQVARVRALAERLQRGWHGACHYGLVWREGEIVREVGRELLATIDGEGGAS